MSRVLVSLLSAGLAAAAVTAATLMAASPAARSSALASAGNADSARPNTDPAQVRTIARSQLATTRARLTVRRTSRYEGVARVHLSVLEHGSWHSVGSRRVTGVFWYVATGPGALCTWSVAESANSRHASPAVVPERRVAVRLLLGPALGCSPRTFHFHEENGRLVRGR